MSSHFFRFRPMSGDIIGHRHTEITLFSVRFLESVSQYRPNSYRDVFCACCELPCYFKTVCSLLANENRVSKFWRQIQILTVFEEIRRYLGPEVEIEKSGSTIF